MATAPDKVPPVRDGEVVKLAIGSLAFGGDGVARLEGYTVFVPFTAPGDLVRAEIREVHKTYARARLVGVDAAGPARVAPACPVAGECGGCGWQQLGYESQLAHKRAFVVESLARIGGLKGVEPGATLPSPDPLHYRNKALVTVAPGPGGVARMGFYAAGSHRVVALPAQGCAIQPALANRVLAEAFAALGRHGLRPYDERAREGQVRNLLVRTVKRGAEALLLVVTHDPLPPACQAWAEEVMAAVPGLKAVLHNHQPGGGNVVLGSQTRHLCGEDHLVEELGGFRFRISADTFFQVNPAQAERLWGTLLGARAWTGREKVLELFCGVGTLSLPIARRAGHVWGFESVAKAVEDARQNQALNGVANATFYAQQAAYAFQAMDREGVAPDLLVLDPPRKGLEPGLLAEVARRGLPEILYVSCDPASLARDVGALCGEGGYRVASLSPVDMFPQTYHVETVAHLIH